jgi:glycosyltransferase 2 family protein
MNKNLKYLLSVFLTIIILFIIFSQINFSEFSDVIKDIDIIILIIALLMLIPQILLNAYRWLIMINDYRKITLNQSIKATLLSQSLNVVTPSHFGEIGKAYVLRNKSFNMKIGTAAVLFEKAIDLLSLLSICVIGLFIIKPELNFLLLIIIFFIIVILLFILMFIFNFQSDGIVQKIIKYMIPYKKLKNMLIDMLDYFDTIKKNFKKLLSIFLITTIKWFINFFQIYLFFLAIGVKIDFLMILALIPLGIIVGMVPITIAGIGTRDAAFIYLFKDIVSPSVMAVFGMIFSLRYIIPAIGGLPFLWRKIK